MTEAEWLECLDPNPLLKYLTDKVSERRLRLFCVACCRNIWHLITEEQKQLAVISVEEYADSRIITPEMRAIAQLFPDGNEDALFSCHDYSVAYATLPFSYSDLGFESSQAAFYCADNAARAFSESVVPDWDAVSESSHNNFDVVPEEGPKAIALEKTIQCKLLRDIFGNPFRPVTLDPRWQSSTVLDLARTIYDQRTFEHMPILADALMDAGCDNDEIIQHCQGPGPHVARVLGGGFADGAGVEHFLPERPISG